MAQPNDRSALHRKVVSCLVGGVVAGFAAPVICAVGGGMLVATVGAGIVCSAVTTITDNATTPDVRSVRYNPGAAQRLFRSAVSQFLAVHFDPVIEAVRHNRAADFGPMTFLARVDQAQGVMNFAYRDGMSIFVEYEFRVRPRPGASARTLEESEPPADLPEFDDDPAHTETYVVPDDLRNANQSLFDGLGWAVVRGAAVGAVGGLMLPLAPGWYFLETAPGVAGIVYGIPTATGSASSVVELANHNPTPYERIAYSVHFGSEVALHVNRVLNCAQRNSVELQYHVRVGMGKTIAMSGGIAGPGAPSQGTEWAQVWYENGARLH